MKKIFFITYGGGHMKIIEPIAKKLQNMSIDFQILALTTAYPYLKEEIRKQNIKQLSDYMFLFKKNKKIIQDLGLEYLLDNYNIKSPISKEETINYIGLNFFDLINQYGLSQAKNLYNEKKRQSFLPIRTMETILKYEKPNLVVTTSSPRFEQASLIAAKNLNITNLQILDLFSDLSPLPESNHIVVMNESVKRGLLNRGVTKKNYYILGQPALEQTYKKASSLSKESIKKKLKLNSNPCILFATQPLIQTLPDGSKGKRINYGYILDNYSTIINEISNTFKTNILFRTHPNENIKNYLSFFKQHKNIFHTNEYLDLYDSLCVCDILVTHSSTIGIEALMLNKQVLTFQHKYDIKYPITELQNSPFIFSKGFKNLSKAIIKCLKNEAPLLPNQNFIPKNSTKNIVALLLKLI